MQPRLRISWTEDVGIGGYEHVAQTPDGRSSQVCSTVPPVEHLNTTWQAFAGGSVILWLVVSLSDVI